MDGRGRVFDNIFIERLWRSLKYEKVYLSDWEKVAEARNGIREYFNFYNCKRPHQGKIGKIGKIGIVGNSGKTRTVNSCLL